MFIKLEGKTAAQLFESNYYFLVGESFVGDSLGGQQLSKAVIEFIIQVLDQLNNGV